MGNIYNLALVVGLDPVYLGAILSKAGFDIPPSGDVDIDAALALLVARKREDELLVKSMAPALSSPRPAKGESLGSGNSRKSKGAPRKHQWQLALPGVPSGKPPLLAALVDHGVDAVWDPEKRSSHENWIRVDGRRMYICARSITRHDKNVHFAVPENVSFEWVFVYVHRRGQRKSFGLQMLAYTEGEFMAVAARRAVAENRRWATLAIADQYYLKNRIHEVLAGGAS